MKTLLSVVERRRDSGRARASHFASAVAALLCFAWPGMAVAQGTAEPVPEASNEQPPPPTYPTPPSYPTPKASQQQPAQPGQPSSGQSGELVEPPSVPSSLGAAWNSGDHLSALAFHASLGLAFGGEELVSLTYTDGTSVSIHAGDGVLLTGGLTFTPLWIGDRIGLGLGLDAGWKYRSTSVDADGSMALERFPLIGSARGLIGITNAWHVLLAGGVVYELGPDLTGEGLLSEYSFEFDNALGGMAELGITWGRPMAVGWEISGRYTFLTYNLESGEGGDVDASSGTLNLTAHFFL
jgi:hypothetical protein